MDEFQKLKQIERIAVALEVIAAELQRLNKEGIVVFGGQTMEEN